MTVQIMKNTIKLSSLFVLLTIVSLSSCTKELPTGGVHFCTKEDPLLNTYMTNSRTSFTLFDLLFLIV